MTIKTPPRDHKEPKLSLEAIGKLHSDIYTPLTKILDKHLLN